MCESRMKPYSTPLSCRISFFCIVHWDHVYEIGSFFCSIGHKFQSLAIGKVRKMCLTLSTLIMPGRARKVAK